VLDETLPVPKRIQWLVIGRLAWMIGGPFHGAETGDREPTQPANVRLAFRKKPLAESPTAIFRQ